MILICSSWQILGLRIFNISNFVEGLKGKLLPEYGKGIRRICVCVCAVRLVLSTCKGVIRKESRKGSLSISGMYP